ncbi:lytic murein transglycosylase [Halorhodospira halochloris]|uniref:lytic murein transglycosylase n=1 Tax=Halorhodospira halochloris TaxID=1052 RepID=UPI001EE83B98|nr:lytic murein transglycosylase [Halorhodospira halochloris]MCG5547721.1 lytic murein transglycosylase [Halorhodospira halochloris]
MTRNQRSTAKPQRNILTAVAIILMLFAFTTNPAAKAEKSADEQFAQCVQELGDELQEAGFSPSLVDKTLADVERRERIVELDRSQPETLQHFSEYLDNRVTEQRIERGRLIYDVYADLLWKIHDDFGISPRYLVALWGMETHYGAYFGQVPIVDAIVTLSCDERRPQFFRGELADIIALLEKGKLQTDQLYGSWAGAMGHTQFMPSTMRAHAIDYDGSGSIDLRDSVPDALASAANFLNEIGWRSGERWGREVSLSDDFEFQHLGLNEKLTVNEWSELGIRRADGSYLPDSEIEASLLLPMGRNGPAFLVYENFRKILRWNPSQSFALAVGYLADLIDGAPELRSQNPDSDQLLDFEQMRAVQQMLNELGHDAGNPDGLLGPKTRRATRSFQQENGIPADGFPDRDIYERLREETGEA